MVLLNTINTAMKRNLEAFSRPEAFRVLFPRVGGGQEASNAVVDLLDGARHEVVIFANGLDFNPITSALLRAASRRLEVKVIVDYQRSNQTTSNMMFDFKSQPHLLAAALHHGCQVRYWVCDRNIYCLGRTPTQGSSRLEGNTILVDNRIMYTGSKRLLRSHANSAEISTITSGALAVDQFAMWVRDRWERLQNVPPEPLPTCEPTMKQISNLPTSWNLLG